MNEDEKTPQASAQTRKTWLENDIEHHESKLYHLDAELVELRRKVTAMEGQRRNLVSYLNEAQHKLDDVTRLVELETEVASLRSQLAVKNGVED